MNVRTLTARSAIALVCALLAPVPAAHAGVPIGTAFTYQGSLSDGGVPATGAYDFKFTLYDALTGGTIVGSTLVLDDVQVVSGVFAVDLDFGASAYYAAEARWLLVETRAGSSTGIYTALPRQRLSATPSALGLSLPVSQLAPSNFPLLTLTNTGIGSGGLFLSGAGTTLNYGLEGITQSSASQSAGLRGWATAASGNVIGVEGVATASPSGTGLVGTGSATGAYLSATGANSTGLYAYGSLRGIYAENTSTGAAIVAVGHGGTGSASVQVQNNATGPAISLTGKGSAATNATLQVENTNATDGIAAYVRNSSGFATAHLRNAGSGQILWLEDAGPSGDFIVATGTGGLKFWVDGAGTTHTKVLEILGGADLSETFDVADDEAPAPGSVVSIDPDHEGRLTLTREPYDRRVAGIVSGAGGVKTGMLMGQAGSVASGAHAVALTGRVYCRATAANGPIRPGDLLTTSAVAGCAMRVDDSARAQGAILGKAMGSLEAGEGLVLVLVGLQ